jgi:hypothetical protein
LWLRAVARLLFLITAIAAIGTRQLPVTSVIYLALTLWLGWVRPVGKSLRDWRPRRVRGVYFRKNRLAWVELLLGVASTGCLVISLALCIMDVLVYALDFSQSPLVVGGVLDPRYLNSLPSSVELFVAVLVAIPTNDLLQLTSIIVLLLLASAAMLRRFGRRFALADAVIAQKSDKRQPILYLRNFNDDALKMPSSSLARTSFTERFSIVRLQPFEEILVRHLRALGPVIALSQPGVRIPELGAAKVACTDETWKPQIREWAARASLVVVAATPREMSCGLTWEIEFLAKEGAGVPVLLVFSPYKQKEIENRWAMFWAEAIRLPRFRALAHFLEHNSGAHFMGQQPDGRWVAWGAAKRSEYTYAVSFAEASKTLVGRQLLGAGGTIRQPRWTRDAPPGSHPELGNEA